MTHCVRVMLQGVLVYGVIDSGADIMILGGRLFKKVALVVKLRKKDFKKPDKTPQTYDQKPFRLDVSMDLDIEFDVKVTRTPVYI